MQLEEKKQIVKEITVLFDDYENLIVTGYQGLSVNSLTAMRSRLRKAGCGMKVVKNRLVVRSLAEMGRDEYAGMEDYFTGPTALIFTSDDPSEAIKIFKEYSESNELMEFKGAVLGSVLFSGRDVARIALLPSREVLLAQTASALNAPIQGLYNALGGIIKRLMYGLKEYAEIKESTPSEKSVAEEEMQKASDPVGEKSESEKEAEPSVAASEDKVETKTEASASEKVEDDIESAGEEDSGPETENKKEE